MEDIIETQGGVIRGKRCGQTEVVRSVAMRFGRVFYAMDALGGE